MPIYEYHCQDCGQQFEKFLRSSNNQDAVECPHCHSRPCPIVQHGQYLRNLNEGAVSFHTTHKNGTSCNTSPTDTVR